MEQADIETQESVIRVVSPTDVQFKLDDQDKEEVTKTNYKTTQQTNKQTNNKRVVSPTDVQFKLDDQDKEEVMKPACSAIQKVLQQHPLN